MRGLKLDAVAGGLGGVGKTGYERVNPRGGLDGVSVGVRPAAPAVWLKDALAPTPSCQFVIPADSYCENAQNPAQKSRENYPGSTTHQ